MSPPGISTRPTTPPPGSNPPPPSLPTESGSQSEGAKGPQGSQTSQGTEAAPKGPETGQQSEGMPSESSGFEGFTSESGDPSNLMSNLSDMASGQMETMLGLTSAVTQMAVGTASGSLSDNIKTGDQTAKQQFDSSQQEKLAGQSSAENRNATSFSERASADQSYRSAMSNLMEGRTAGRQAESSNRSSDVAADQKAGDNKGTQNAKDNATKQMAQLKGEVMRNPQMRQVRQNVSNKLTQKYNLNPKQQATLKTLLQARQLEAKLQKKLKGMPEGAEKEALQAELEGAQEQMKGLEENLPAELVAELPKAEKDAEKEVKKNAEGGEAGEAKGTGLKEGETVTRTRGQQGEGQGEQGDQMGKGEQPKELPAVSIQESLVLATPVFSRGTSEVRGGEEGPDAPAYRAGVAALESGALHMVSEDPSVSSRYFIRQRGERHSMSGEDLRDYLGPDKDSEALDTKLEYATGGAATRGDVFHLPVGEGKSRIAIPGYMVSRLGKESADGTATFSYGGKEITLSAAEVAAVQRATSVRTGILARGSTLSGATLRGGDYFAGARV